MAQGMEALMEKLSGLHLSVRHALSNKFQSVAELLSQKTLMPVTEDRPAASGGDRQGAKAHVAGAGRKASRPDKTDFASLSRPEVPQSDRRSGFAGALAETVRSHLI